MPSFESRRQFLYQCALSCSGIFCSSLSSCSSDRTNPHILLKSGWQTVNIGDIAHTPGILALLKQYIPEAEITLWPKRSDRGVREMLKRHFPDLEILAGSAETDAPSAQKQWQQAIHKADFLLHGSGPSVAGRDSVKLWMEQTDKPFGILGVTIGRIRDIYKQILSASEFVFTRETKSLDNIKEAKLQCPVNDFAPDATFAMDILNEDKATRFLAQHHLKEQQYICVIPRLRKTPYHKVYEHNKWPEEKIKQVKALNDKHKHKDHGKLREVMIKWVRETGYDVLICPEMTYQLEIMDELLIDPLPEDIKKHVVKRDTYWLPDEAASVYKRAHTVISLECHSPIIAAAQGTPCFYVRQPEDSIKGQMWYDIGLDDWIFEIDQIQGADISKQLFQIHNDYPAALDKLQQAMQGVRNQYQKAMQIVRENVMTASQKSKR
ncbi:polysaccharide pyruvyl transferase family protein [candidate division KSB1 bacterium]|nr:polysaccharide pyruvyl transferase family protein [candidate division KSB1 bacterium]